MTRRAFSGSMMQCVDGLQPLCYRSTVCHNSLSSLKRQLQIDSLIDTWIDRFGQLPIRHGGLLIFPSILFEIFLLVHITSLFFFILFLPSPPWNANNSKSEHWLPLIKKSSHHQTRALRALSLPPFSLRPSWNLPPETPTPSPLLNIFFPLRGGTLRKNVIQHIQPSAPQISAANMFPLILSKN